MKNLTNIDGTSKEANLKFEGLKSQSPLMKPLFESIKRIANFKTTVLLVGESGTGKELFAKSIHDNSDRAGKSFIAINCGALPEHLIESELFGHRKGSFTDATKDKKGLFEEATGGTIFLDEIGELPFHLQAKLLRVLQDSCIRPVGGEEQIKVDVRVIAATLRDLEQDSIEGRFRDDLLYRLNVVTLEIPPLRSRKEDISDLAHYLIKKLSKKLNLKPIPLAESTLKTLTEYNWPGNIRELENYLERALILCNQSEIRISDLPSKIFLKESNSSLASPNDFLDNLSIKFHSKNLEVELITLALNKTKGNKTHAAKLLEISHRTLLYKIKEYELEDKDIAD
jgi:two-component system response regulator AtoC